MKSSWKDFSYNFVWNCKDPLAQSYDGGCSSVAGKDLKQIFFSHKCWTAVGSRDAADAFSLRQECRAASSPVT